MEKLVEIFKTGVVCDFVMFQDDDRTTRALWYCSVHDEESNKYRPSSFHSKISMVATQYERYKTLEETKKQIVKALGSGKAVTVGKWIRAYKNLHADVKAVLGSFILGSPYRTSLISQLLDFEDFWIRGLAWPWLSHRLSHVKPAIFHMFQFFPM